MNVVRYTTLLSLVFFFSYGPLEAALPLYSDTVLQTDARGYALLWSALAVGALIGTLSSNATTPPMHTSAPSNSAATPPSELIFSGVLMK